MSLIQVLVLTLPGLVCATGAHAQEKAIDTIIVVPTRHGGAYRKFINAFDASLRKSKGGKEVSVRIVLSADAGGKQFRQLASQAKIIVTVGTVAASRVLQTNPAAPVLNTLVPRSSYLALARQTKTPRTSSIFLDQPLERHLGLIGSILPRNRNLGVVLGPNTRYLQNELKLLVGRKGLRVKIEEMNKSQQLVGSLNRALEESNVFLAVPDPVVSNRRTVQNLLLTTYRQRVPVFAYSRAYVKAGALAAVFSTPEQIGRQAGEFVGELVKTDSAVLPSPQYPKYFSVEINSRVAQSFEIHVPSTREVMRRLQRDQGITR